MKLHITILLLIILVCSGCAKKELGISAYSPANMAPGVAAEQNASSEMRPDRLLIWRANMGIDVGDIKEAINKATTIAEQCGGYVEWKSETIEHSAQVRLRIPVKKFKNTISSLDELGTVTSKNVTGEDVTEKYIDVQARLKNKYALRDRLKLLLDKAVTVKDILEIEGELNRVQSDIDSMEGIIKSLKGQADFSTIDLSFKKKKILGPLGYVFNGLWWGVKKLFVITD